VLEDTYYVGEKKFPTMRDRAQKLRKVINGMYFLIFVFVGTNMSYYYLSEW